MCLQCAQCPQCGRPYSLTATLTRWLHWIRSGQGSNTGTSPRVLHTPCAPASLQRSDSMPPRALMVAALACAGPGQGDVAQYSYSIPVDYLRDVVADDRHYLDEFGASLRGPELDLSECTIDADGMHAAARPPPSGVERQASQARSTDPKTLACSLVAPPRADTRSVPTLVFGGWLLLVSARVEGVLAVARPLVTSLDKHEISSFLRVRFYGLREHWSASPVLDASAHR